MFVLIFSTTLARNASHSEKKCARYDKKSMYWSSMRTDGETDRTKLIVAFRNFANAP